MVRAFLARPPAMAAALVAVLLGSLLPDAQAQTPTNPYSYSRSSSFTYYGAADGVKNGLLKTETIEPDNIASCVVTTYDYDAYGNKKSATTANCAGSVPTLQQFTSRTSGSTFDPATPPTVTVTVNGAAGVNVVLPKGAFPITSTNALNQTESKEYDPRFGAVTKLTGPNQLITRATLDDFGRPVRQTSADGTSSVSFYCYLSGRVSNTSTNTTGCPSPAAAEIPAEAVSFVHSEPRNTADAKMGPASRVYSDRLGRTIRSVTESFDGAGQTTSLSGVAIVQDIVYNRWGGKVLETQPYFLATGASTTGGANNVGVTRTDYDALGRPSVVFTADPNGLTGGTQVFGGSSGTVSYGVYGSKASAKTSFSYAGSLTKTTNDKSQLRTEEMNVEGKLVRVTDAAGAQIAYQHDAFGNLIATKDALQNTITLSYDFRGRKTQLSDPDTGLWKYDYDALGQLVWQESPNQRAAGTTTTMAYDKLGRMTSRVEPEGTTTWTYDQYADASACTTGVGKLCDVKVQRSPTDYFTRKYVYDGYGRPVNTRTSVNGGPSFASAVAYDASGRLASQVYPTGVKVNYAYTGLGYLEKLTLATAVTVAPLPSTPGGTPVAGTTLAANTPLWTAKVVNAWGKTEQQGYSNTVNTLAQFDAVTGRALDLSAGTGTNVGTTANVFGLAYTWDSLDNLQTKTDRLSAGGGVQINEIFEYADGLNRLTKYTVNAPQAGAGGTRAVTLQYNALGMLLYKSDVGVYTYGASGNGAVRPHALQKLTSNSVTSYSYDANGNLTSASAGKYRSITYNSFNLPDSQTGLVGAPGGASGGTAQYTWAYDESHARMKELRTITGGSLAGTRTTWNLHPDSTGGLGYEMEVNSPSPATTANPAVTSHRHYLSMGGQAIGVLVTTGNLPTLNATQTAPTELGSVTVVKLEYWHKDHLGSLVATTDHAGNVTARYAYDPFGKRRNLDGSYDAQGNLVIDFSAATNNGTDRGYTGHEHLDDVGVIHMNGRIFDPTLGIFLQGDPFIQNPGDLQNYNRYGYCSNNPLTCTDPSGFFSWKRLFRAERTLLFSNSPVKRMRAGFDLIHNLPGQSILDRFIVSNAWANQLGQAAATYFTFFCGGCGGYVWTAYYTYQATGSLSASGRAVLVSYASSYMFTAAGTVGGADGANTFGRYAAHAAAGCASAYISGGDCGQGALSAVAGKYMTNQLSGWKPANGAEGFAKFGAAMVAGGTASVIGGGKFANGALTAAYGYIYNEMMSSRFGGSSRERAERSGYAEKPYDDGTYCNIQGAGSGACGFPNSVSGPSNLANKDEIKLAFGFFGGTPGGLIALAWDLSDVYDAASDKKAELTLANSANIAHGVGGEKIAESMGARGKVPGRVGAVYGYLIGKFNDLILQTPPATIKKNDGKD